MKVKELLTDKSKWTQKMYACDINGERILENDDKAVSWCLVGAINKCYSDKSRCSQVLDMVLNHFGFFEPYKLVDWNDSPDRTFDDVCKLIQELDI